MKFLYAYHRFSKVHPSEIINHDPRVSYAALEDATSKRVPDELDFQYA